MLWSVWRDWHWTSPTWIRILYCTYFCFFRMLSWVQRIGSFITSISFFIYFSNGPDCLESIILKIIGKKFDNLTCHLQSIILKNNRYLFFIYYSQRWQDLCYIEVNDRAPRRFFSNLWPITTFSFTLCVNDWLLTFYENLKKINKHLRALRYKTIQ